MRNTNTRQETGPGPERAWANILVVASVILSCASVVWTTYSVLDLLNVGVIAVTVAATLDLVWISIQYAQHKAIPLMGRRRATEIAGWASIAAVVGLLVWHGVSLRGQTVAGQYIDSQTSWAIAVASPMLPVGAKLVMMLAVARFRDPIALSPEDEDTLNSRRRQEVFAAREREIAGEQRQATHTEWLRQQAEQREKDRAQAEADREKARAEHENRMALMAQQREREAAEAAASLDQQRAEAERAKAEEKLKADLAMAAISSQNQIDMLRATAGVEIDIQRADLENDLRRRMPLTIRGESVRSAPRALPATGRRSGVTASITPLSPAQQAKKRLAEAFYLAQSHAAREGHELTQGQFARDNGVNAVEVSRALNMFGPEDVAEAG